MSIISIVKRIMRFLLQVGITFFAFIGVYTFSVLGVTEPTVVKYTLKEMQESIKMNAFMQNLFIAALFFVAGGYIIIYLWRAFKAKIIDKKKGVMSNVVQETT